MQEIQQEFFGLLNRYAAQARWWKIAFTFCRVGAILITWFNLICGVIALTSPDSAFTKIWLSGILFVTSFLGVTISVIEFICGPEQRWLDYRLAEQRLGQLAMWFRGRVPPLHDHSQLDTLRDCLAEIRGAFERRTDIVALIRKTLDDLKPIKTPPHQYLSVVQQGLEPDFFVEENSYLMGRLHEQRYWFLKKARLNRRRHFGFLIGVLAVNLFNMIWSRVAGETVWLPVITTLIILALYELRDFFDASSLWRRYRQTALNLDQCELAYLERQPPYHVGDEETRVKRLVENVEQILAAEFHLWMVAKQRPDEPELPIVMSMDYKPKPIDTSHVTLPADLQDLSEKLAENVHENWSVARLAEGWRVGPVRNERKKETPNLAPYAQLPDSEREYDRITARETLKVLLALGFEIKWKPPS